MHILVLGAGIAGVTAAWELQKDGHEVVLLDAGAQVANGATHANGGQIAVSDSAPWSRPGLVFDLLKQFPRSDAPYRLKLRLAPAQWRWLFRFWQNCSVRAHKRGTARNRLLAQYSQTCLQMTREQLGDELAYDGRQTGNLQLIATAEQAIVAQDAIAHARAQNIDLVWLEADALVHQEPALAEAVAGGLVRGAVWSRGDESGDAAKFTQILANAFIRRGGTLRLNCIVQGFVLSGQAGQAGQATPAASATNQAIYAVQTNQGDITADAIVLAAGTQSSDLAAMLGLYLPVLPVKGYSVTVPIRDAEAAPQASLTDMTHRLVITRLGRTLRAAGYAEIGMDAQIDPKRTKSIMDYLMHYFPRAGDYTRPENWVGFRPLTPDSAPIIGRMRHYHNLWLHTGHGTLGWTLAHGTARMLADMMSGATPQCDATPFAPDRRFLSAHDGL